jgi:putative transposase
MFDLVEEALDEMALFIECPLDRVSGDTGRIVGNDRGVGAMVKEIIGGHGISEQTFYRWKSRYGGMDASEARRLKELEAENAKLEKLLAEAHLDNAALKDALSRKW